MYNILLLGAGKIGSCIAKLLTLKNNFGGFDYNVTVCDVNSNALTKFADLPNIQTTNVLNDATFKDKHAVVSALPFYANMKVADQALRNGVSYFDLTEDVETTRFVEILSAQAKDGQIFMPQCGLAPGFIGIVANSLAKEFDSLEKVKMRVGALPKCPTNRLKYNLTWSSDGLINEYLKPCDAISQGKRETVKPLEGLEFLTIDGSEYEAFNTSGGLGTLCESMFGKVEYLDYKTIRYPGHRDLMAFLIEDMKLGANPKLFKEVLEEALPATTEDVVITFVSITGYKDGRYLQKTDVRKVYSTHWFDDKWTAIQLTTAAGICTAIDLFFAGKLPQKGFVCQEDIELNDLLQNRFGRVYNYNIQH